MNKKIVRCSNLAARFYEFDGWTLEELNKYLVKGRFIKQGGRYGDRVKDTVFGDLDPVYYILDVGSSYDVDKLAEVATVKTAFPEQPTEVKEFLRSFNW